MQVTRRLARFLWFLLPLGIVLAFDRMVVTALTLWHQAFGGLTPNVFFFLPFASVVPPLLLFVISYLQGRRDPSRRLIVCTRAGLAGDVWRGVVTGMLCVIAFVGSLRVLRSVGVAAPDFSSLSLAHHVFFSTIGALIPGIAEELYFRGFLMARFRDLRPTLLIALTSASFALWHILSPSYLLHTFIIGLILGFTVYRTQRLLPAMIAHTLANASAGILILRGCLG
jgi:membrane protease YdiL (CAAX protease family)